MWRMWVLTVFAVLSLGIAQGQEALGACKEIAPLTNINDTKTELVHFQGNITILAMLNSSMDTCIQQAELINGLHNQLVSSQYNQMNFVVLDTARAGREGDRQNSQRMLDVAGNVTVLSNARHNITGSLKPERDYILVINRCGRQIFQMIDPCTIRCSDLKTAIFTTFYDDVYQFCGNCQTPYTTPIHESVQNLPNEFYKNIDNCGILNATGTNNTDDSAEFSSETYHNGPSTILTNTTTESNINKDIQTSGEQWKTLGDQDEQTNINEDNMNIIHRSQNSNEGSHEINKVIPINLHLDLPNMHTINYKIIKHTHVPVNKNTNMETNEIFIEKNGKRTLVTASNENSDDNSAIQTQYYDGKHHNKKHSKTTNRMIQNVNDNDERQMGQSIEETLNDNIIEFTNGTATNGKQEYGFQLTDRHALFHHYSKLLPKLRELLEEHKNKRE